MQIIMGEEAAANVRENYVLLELDTFRGPDKVETPAYAVLEASSIPLGEMQELPKWIEHHNKIMENYRKQNWNFCEQMIEHCRPRWGGELASFYVEIYARIQDLKNKELPEDWDGVIQR